MWIQLASTMSIEQAGRMTTYHPGDWVNVGKQTALQWISEGTARAIDPSRLDIFPTGTGIFVRGDPNRVKAVFGPSASEETITGFGPILHFDKTLVLKFTGNRPRMDVLAAAWPLLDRWEVVVPLLDYNRLALTMGDEAERHRTAQFVRDLRVPVYDSRMIFVRRCEAGQRLVDTFFAECALGKDEHLAFLRAVHITKPLILATPRTWYDVNAHRSEEW